MCTHVCHVLQVLVSRSMCGRTRVCVCVCVCVCLHMSSASMRGGACVGRVAAYHAKLWGTPNTCCTCHAPHPHLPGWGFCTHSQAAAHSTPTSGFVHLGPARRGTRGAAACKLALPVRRKSHVPACLGHPHAARAQRCCGRAGRLRYACVLPGSEPILLAHAPRIACILSSRVQARRAMRAWLAYPLGQPGLKG